MHQQVSAIARLLIGHERVIDDVGEDSIDILTGDVEEARVAFVLAPLRPGRPWPLGRRSCEHEACAAESDKCLLHRVLLSTSEQPGRSLLPAIVGVMSRAGRAGILAKARGAVSRC